MEGKGGSKRVAANPGSGGAKTSAGPSAASPSPGSGKSAGRAETAKQAPPRKRAVFPDPVPVVGCVHLVNTEAASPRYEVDGEAQCIKEAGKAKFRLDTVLESPTLKDMYQDSIFPAIAPVFDGYDACVVALPLDNATAATTLHQSGKEDGLLVQCFEDVFRSVQAQSGGGRQFMIEVSYLLVGSGNAYDLLCTKATRMGKPLAMRPSQLDSNALRPDGHTKEVVSSEDVLLDVYQRGKAFQQQLYETVPELAKTGAQPVLNIVVESCEPINGKDHYRKGSLQIVDCRANEIKRSRGLASLFDAVSALNSGSQPRWNAALLTDVLRDAIGGGSLFRCIGCGALDGLINTGCLDLIHRLRLIKCKPVLKPRTQFQLKEYKDQLAALKTKLQNSKRANDVARKQELRHEADRKKEMLAKRLEQRKLQMQRAKEKAEFEKKRAAKLEEMRKNGTLKEPTIKYKIIEKEVVVEREVEKEIIEKVIIGQRDEDIAEQKRLREGASLTLEERNKLAEDALRREEEIQEKERQRLETERQFKALQMKVLGLASGNILGEDEDGTVLDPKIIIARQQEQLKKAEYELKEQKKKESKLRAMSKKLRVAHEKAERRLRQAKSGSASHSKKKQAVKDQGQSAVSDAMAALRKKRDAHNASARSSAAKHHKAVKEVLLMETLVHQFLTWREVDDLRALSEHHGGRGERAVFEVPTITPTAYSANDRIRGYDDGESWAASSVNAASAASPKRKSGGGSDKNSKKDKKELEDAEKSLKKYRKIVSKLGSEVKSLKKKVINPTADALQTMDTAKAVQLLKVGVERLQAVLKSVGYNPQAHSGGGKKEKKEKKSSRKDKKDKKRRGSSNKPSGKKASTSADDGKDPWDDFEDANPKSLNDEERNVFDELMMDM